MFYGNYADRVKGVVAEARTKKDLEKGLSYFTGIETAIKTKRQLIAEQKAFSNKMQLNAQPLSTILSPHYLNDAKIGLHPDFIHLKGTSETEEHYIVSVFIDIKGSTDLFKEYDKVDVYRITNTIQSAAIHTCLALGGHIQRLHGDGVFAYFGGKNKTKEDATHDALVACSMFTYFVKNDLKNVFLEEGVEDIRTRIGVDFGDDDDVLWANFGLLDVNELTTISLHTSLASKMQAHAKPNGIVVGQNVRDKLTLDDSFYDLVRDSYGEVKKRYIFSNPKDNFYYTQYCFDWYKFLKTLPFIKAGKDGDLQIIDPKKIEEEERINRLLTKATAIDSGTAYLDRYGNINTESKGVKHEPHRFHYEK